MRNFRSSDPVVIIGASSAGLVAAHLLAEAGVPVHVYERAPQLRHSARTLIVTPELCNVLNAPLAPATVNTVNRLDLCTSRRTVPISLGEPDLVIERSELLCVLAKRAEAAGAVLKFGHDFVTVQANGSGAVLEFQRKHGAQTVRIPAHAVIAADGAHSRVARSLGVRNRPMVSVLQARVVRPRSDTPEVGKVWFLPRETKYFYWLCPETEDFAALGVVDANPRAARLKLDRFISAQGMRPVEYQAAMIPLYQPNPRPARRVGRCDILFVGDAAGQVKVTTIGGTVTGVRGAIAAAQSIIRGSSYMSELRGLNRELQLHWVVRNLMNRFFEHEYDALLQLFAGSVGQLLSIHNRDRMTRAFWPMLAMQPRLPLLAAQVLWRAGFGS